MPEIIFGYRVRSLPKETPFWTAFGLWFDYDPVAQEVKVSDDTSTWRLFGNTSQNEDLTFVFVAHRRSGSENWVVPDDDEDLLAGVGALGTASHKGDDHFEQLLLMQMDLGN